MTTVILITNLSGVNVGDIRTTARALLLEDNGPPSKDWNGPRHRLRGFGVEAVNAIFGMTLPSIEYVFDLDRAGVDVASKFDGKVLSTHGALRVVESSCYYAGNEAAKHQDDYEQCSCAVLDLDCDSQDGKPIDFERFEGDARDPKFFQSIWARLHAKALHYCGAPFVGIRSQVEINLARRATRHDLTSGDAYLVVRQ